MENTIIKIENLMKEYLDNDPFISKSETDKIAKEAVLEITKNLSEDMLSIIGKQINFNFCKSMFKDYLILKSKKEIKL